MRNNSIFSSLAFLLIVGQLLVCLLSWIFTAAMPETFTRSLLSAEGIRFFFGNLCENISTPFLVWLLFLSVAYGTFRESGIWQFDRSEYRHRIAIRMVWAEFFCLVVIILALTVVPDAILLNVMGGWSNSSFSRGIVPYVCLGVVVMSVSYGMVSDHMKSLDDVFGAMARGVGYGAPVLLVYILLKQLVASLIFLEIL